ncbi:hypothetical protein L916_11775 [Phytophthora nicotianae]|uniref:Uncharacterized protein n=1 Tax=Phytophthora nicotianae TaxID=4792 RepID=W2IPR8_PHYNI|nr:hypothetical protein L916_11775 [Phytophthora nicotianae]
MASAHNRTTPLEYPYILSTAITTHTTVRMMQI